MRLLKTLACSLVFAALVGCPALPPQPSAADQQLQARQLIDSINSATSTAAAVAGNLRDSVAAAKAIATAATQPIVVTPATPTTPAVTLPAPAPVVQAADAIGKAADKADRALEIGQQAIGGLQATNAALKSALDQSSTREQAFQAQLQAVNETLKTVADTVHATAPGTKADDSARMVQAIGSIVTGLAVGLAGIFAGQKTAHAAITQPGTTPTPPPAPPS